VLLACCVSGSGSAQRAIFTSLSRRRPVRVLLACCVSGSGSAQHHPCLCLWRGFEQMICTTPPRRITRQRSHIGFTEARTFIALSLGRIQSLAEKARQPHESGPRARKVGRTAEGRW
jgi:hypothetical protein